MEPRINYELERELIALNVIKARLKLEITGLRSGVNTLKVARQWLGDPDIKTRKKALERVELRLKELKGE